MKDLEYCRLFAIVKPGFYPSKAIEKSNESAFARDNMATIKMESMVAQLDQITLKNQFANVYKAKLIELTSYKLQSQKVVAEDVLDLGLCRRCRDLSQWTGWPSG